MKTFLIIAAHPDDEVLGCGATAARLIRQGYIGYSLILGEGITSRDDLRDPIKREKELSTLKIKAAKANHVLGIKETRVLDFPDNRFDSVALLDIIKCIEKTLARIKPELVFTHFADDLNIDHRVTFQAVLTATRPKTGQSVKQLLSFEIPSSTDWAFGTAFVPNLFFNVSATLKCKMKALLHYDSEMAAFPHPRSPENIEAAAIRWGAAAGLKRAEAFIQIRTIVP